MQNKKTLIVILSLIVLIVFAYFVFAEIKDREIKKLAEKYNKLAKSGIDPVQERLKEINLK